MPFVLSGWFVRNVATGFAGVGVTRAGILPCACVSVTLDIGLTSRSPARAGASRLLAEPLLVCAVVPADVEADESLKNVIDSLCPVGDTVSGLILAVV